MLNTIAGTIAGAFVVTFIYCYFREDSASDALKKTCFTLGLVLVAIVMFISLMIPYVAPDYYAPICCWIIAPLIVIGWYYYIFIKSDLEDAIGWFILSTPWMNDLFRLRENRLVLLFTAITVPLGTGILLELALPVMPAIPTMYWANTPFVRRVDITNISCESGNIKTTSIAYIDNVTQEPQDFLVDGDYCSRMPDIINALRGQPAILYGRQWFLGTVIEKITSNNDPDKNKIIFNLL